jgi:hypothetical protein
VKVVQTGGLPLLAKEPRVTEILAQDRKTTGKTRDDRQYESYQPDECEWVLPDSGSGSDSQVVDLRVHARHGDAWQRQHLSGIAPVHPPDPETLSGSATEAHHTHHTTQPDMRGGFDRQASPRWLVVALRASGMMNSPVLRTV